MILKNTVKTTTQYNTITQFNLVKLKDFCRNCTLLLYCIVLFSEQFKKIEKKTITQYNLVTFKVFMQLQYVGFGTIKKKQKKSNNTIQHNNTIQFGKTYYCIVL